MKQMRIKINITLNAEDPGDAFAKLSTLAVNRANMWDADEDFTPDPEPEFTGEIDVLPVTDDLADKPVFIETGAERLPS